MRNKIGFLCLALLGTVACGPTIDGSHDSVDAGPAADTVPTPTPSCPSGQQMCGDACTNTRIDADNCGTCGTRCANGSTCRSGTCTIPVPVCTTGQGDCDGNASNGCEINFVTDAANCGACNVRCGSSQVCAYGRCVAAPVTTRCGDGFCSAPSETCSTCSADCGTCAPTCGAGTGNCDGNNSNGCEARLATDRANCGGCGIICASTDGCSAGRCTPFCPGATNCSGSCRDLTTDPANCGACGRICTGSATCRAGVCTAPATCATGLTMCSGACVNTVSDNYNCGACGANCAASGFVCSASRCVPSPTSCTGSGTSYCGGVCRNLYTDVSNCGTCNARCSAGQTCTGGVCTGGDTIATIQAAYAAPSGVRLPSIAIYQLFDHTAAGPGYLQPGCSVAGGGVTTYTGFSCPVLGRIPASGEIRLNVDIDLPSDEATRLGFTSMWAAGVHAAGGPIVAYGTLTVTYLGRSIVLHLASDGRGGGDWVGNVYAP